MLTVNRFLCFSLETGGRVVGWFGVIGTAIVIPILVLLTIFISTLSCEQINAVDEKYLEEFTYQFGINDCHTLFGVIVVIFSVIIAIYMILFVIYFLLLRGISNQNHKQILPAVIVEGICLASYVFYFLTNMTTGLLVEGIITSVLYFYIFIVLYSLYVKIRNGNRRGVINVQFNKPQNV